MRKMTITVPKNIKTRREERELRRLTQDYVDEVLYDDIDWDWSSLVALMRYKIGRMRKCLRTGLSVDAARNSRDMKKVEEALKRLEDDDYFHDLAKKVRKKHQARMDFVKKPDGKSGATSSIATTCWGLEVVPVKKGGKVNLKAYNRDFRAADRKSKRLINADMDLVFDTLKDRMRHWWE